MKGYEARQKQLFTRKTYQWYSNMEKRAKGILLPFTLEEFRTHVAVMFYGSGMEFTAPGCVLCGQVVTLESANLAHLVPLKRGGTWDLGNLWPAHDECNRIQGELLQAEYALLMQLLRTFPEKARTDVLKRLKTAGGFVRMRYFKPKDKKDGGNTEGGRVFSKRKAGTDDSRLFPKAKFRDRKTDSDCF